jgi:hypothetical protein
MHNISNTAFGNVCDFIVLRIRQSVHVGASLRFNAGLKVHTDTGRRFRTLI